MNITVDLNITTDVTTTHSVYSGLSYNNVTNLINNNVTNTLSFIVDNTSIIDDYIFIKVKCDNCEEQIYKIKIR